MGGNFAYDFQGKFYQTTTIYGYIKKQGVQEDYKFWMALLNSRLCWWYMVNTGTVLANGFFRFKPDYINPFPVPQTISKEAERPIITLVDLILSAKKADPQADTSAWEQEIDQLVYQLYGLTEEEIKVVEGKK